MNFNIRVYAIILNENEEILLSDENRHGHSFTKFPGGGLEWGEGLVDGLKRELKEELGLDARIGELFYVNDFFQLSAFQETDQILSFYYFIDEIDTNRIKTGSEKVEHKTDGESFRWVKLSDLKKVDLTFPIDKVVASELIAYGE